MSTTWREECENAPPRHPKGGPRDPSAGAGVALWGGGSPSFQTEALREQLAAPLFSAYFHSFKKVFLGVDRFQSLY